MKDEYVEEIEYQICVETIRCAKIRDILFFEQKALNNKNKLLRYYYALKILLLTKETDISISLEKPELWNQEIVSQLNDSIKILEELCLKLDLYTSKRKI